MERYNLKDYFIFISIGFLLSAPFFILPIANPDIGWHLSNGRYIIENFRIPSRDFLSWLSPEREWINFEWIVGAVYYLIYRFDGYRALCLFKFLNMILICFGFYLLYAKRLRLEAFAFIWFMPSLFLSFAISLDLRPDNYTFFFFTFLLFLLEGYKNSDFSYKRAYLLLSLSALWVNIHAGYIFGWILVSIYLLSFFLNDIVRFLRGQRKDFKNTFKFLKYAVFFSMGIFINPYGYKILRVFFYHYVDMKKLADYIFEWQYSDMFMNISTFYYFVFSFLVILAYFIRFIKARIYELSDVFLLTFFVISSLMHVRLIGFGSIVVHMIFVKSFSDLISKKYIRYFILAVFYSFYFFFEAYVNLVRSCLYFKDGVFYRNTFSSPYAVSFIEKNASFFEGKRIYNDLSSGGDLGFRFYGKRKIFIDGRYIFLDILEEHLNAMRSKESWRAFYRKYNFDYAIYSIYGDKRTEIIGVMDRGKMYAIERPFYLKSIDFENWAIVFFDSISMILVRRDRFPKAFVDEYEYKCVLPYDFERIHFDIHILSKNIECYRREMTDYIRREIRNPNAFVPFFVYELSYINSGGKR